MSEMLHAIAELCVEMEKAPSETAVRGVLRSAAQVFGASFYLFGIRTGRNISPPQQKVLSSYPDAWQHYYDRQRAYAFDPVVNKAFQSVGTFRWDGLHHDERQLALRRESIRHGMEFGFSCSDRGPEGSLAILSFCGDRPLIPNPGDWERAAAAAALLASATNKAMTRLLEAASRRSPVFGRGLSEAERKALTLIATGATFKRAAQALGVKPRTVRYYLDRAAEKLGAATRKEAVLKALADGIIDTREFPPAGFGREPEDHD
jgi:LuxR family transcriptional regulator, quorum-sensing system regulator SolR